MRRTLLLAVAGLLAVLAGASMAADGASADETPTVALSEVATGLDRPLYVTSAPDDADRLYVLEKRGTVRVVENGTVQDGFWLDVRERTTTESERGLLGLAFHPDARDNGEVYVSYTGPDGDSRLVRHVLEDLQAGPGSSQGELLLEVPQPYANHNGGHLAFGPDGNLLYGLGDGGAAGDPEENGQDPHTLLGAILRLDVSPETGYAIPEDNPFEGEEGAPEVWAYGLRNPWRFSVDPATGNLWIGDVGQDQIEEVDREPAGVEGGRNYGWDAYEGSQPYDPPADGDVTFPVMEYRHEAGRCSVTGGPVYRGAAIPHLQGTYVFGDFCTGELFAGVGEGADRTMELLAAPDVVLSSFGVDAEGRLYVVDYAGGAVHRLIATPGPPTNLTATAVPEPGTVELDWDPPAGDGGRPVQAYRVHRAEDPEGPYREVATVDATGYRDTGLADGTTFHYRVSAENAVGEGPTSEAAAARTADTPDAPRDLEAGFGPGLGEVTLEWRPPVHDGGLALTAYRVYRDDDSGGPYEHVATVGAEATTYTDEGRTLPNVYHYVVTATNAAGEGPASEEASARGTGVPGLPLLGHG